MRKTRNYDMLTHWIKDQNTAVAIDQAIDFPRYLAENAEILLDDLGANLMDIAITEDTDNSYLYLLHYQKKLVAKCSTIKDIVTEVKEMLNEIDEYGNENFPATEKPEEVEK